MSGRSIDSDYLSMSPRSRALFRDQREVVSGGYTHRGRVLEPFPLFIERNEGARKWDVDGNEYLDYWLGHGALLLGHSHPRVVDAIWRQVKKGVHAGGESELALRWANDILKLFPSSEMIRFVATGGEATQMAMRVARAYTGKSKVMTFQGAYHGWHDAATIGASPPWDVPSSAGVPMPVSQTTISVPFLDLDAVEKTLSADRDIAAIMLEPGGISDDTVPSNERFLYGVRELASYHDAVLIFDEVVTGFRYREGGAQQAFDVTPDLTALGKVIGGGVSAGALVGRAQIMEVLAWKPDPEWQRYRMVPHAGTWNANPLAAAAGTASVQLISETDAVGKAVDATRALTDSFNTVFEESGVDAFAYGRGSIFKTCRGRRPALLEGDDSTKDDDIVQLLAGWDDRGPFLRKAMLLEGVDLLRQNGFLSTAHTETDIRLTAQAMERALFRMQNEGLL